VIFSDFLVNYSLMVSPLILSNNGINWYFGRFLIYWWLDHSFSNPKLCKDKTESPLLCTISLSVLVNYTVYLLFFTLQMDNIISCPISLSVLVNYTVYLLFFTLQMDNIISCPIISNLFFTLLVGWLEDILRLTFLW
jgi:hypothetical protein